VRRRSWSSTTTMLSDGDGDIEMNLKVRREV
jgi:hypothetical protein